LLEKIVEEMNILITIFLWYHNEQIYYPNLALAKNPIRKMYYSPNIDEALELIVDNGQLYR